jgi:hypothetical protein
VASRLPDRPSLDALSEDARRLREGVSAGDERGLALVQRHHPDAADALADPTAFGLDEAQLTVARAYGLSGWPALVRYLEVAAELSRTPGDVDEARLDDADRFASLASLRYDGTDSPERWANAAELLAADPGLVERSVHAAAAATDPAAIRRHLASDPASADREGGPFRWPPLLHLAYSRVPLGRTAAEVEVAATLLLDAGADPDAGYLWSGLATPFTALTGAFGGGEQGIRRQPPHPHSLLLARLLLERGADPNDGQALYNRMFTREDDHLRVLFAHGLGTPTEGPWRQRLGEALEGLDEMFDRQVRWAAEHGFARRLDLLAEHGIDVSGVALTQWTLPPDPNALVDGRTALHDAAWEGDVVRVQALLEAGADPGIRDLTHGSTPLGWAEHAFQTETADRLRPVTPA